jgi:hypothetical protein
MVVGWTDDAPLNPTVPGHQTLHDSMTLVVGDLPLTLMPGSQTLPPYLVGWQVVAGDTSPGSGNGQLDFNLDTEPAIFQFVLPSGYHASALSVGCDLSAYYGTFSVEPAFYNWTTGQYDPVLQNGQPQLINSTSSGSYAQASLDVPTPVAPYVGPHGEVNLRLTSHNGSSNFQLQDLYISGH